MEGCDSIEMGVAGLRATGTLLIFSGEESTKSSGVFVLIFSGEDATRTSGVFETCAGFSGESARATADRECFFDFLDFLDFLLRRFGRSLLKAKHSRWHSQTMATVNDKKQQKLALEQDHSPVDVRSLKTNSQERVCWRFPLIPLLRL